ncbi:MAG: RNA polymerase factor sigma-54 [Bacteriovoracaceae bacterium]|jgi:RNA polymerase sigma-54 factor|nr:RNA polymerase factor sigma-54 [Bacteriovoracaceae bacterium]
MAIKLSQGLKQLQSLTMTPQLQQAIKLLTLTHLEMTQVIAEEMTENPMLEEANSEISRDEFSDQSQDNSNKEAKSENFDAPDVISGKEDIDWNKYIENFNSTSSSPPSMAKRDSEDTPNYENMVSKGMNLAEHLEWQLRMENLTEAEWQVAYNIIHNIDDDGYLEVSIDEVIELTGHDREDSLELLNMIQQLDPVGCGSRGLVECLLIQAKNLDERMPLVELLITDHLQDLKNKDHDKIAKKLGLDLSQVKDAELIMMEFNPKPGRLISPEETHYIIPDIFVRFVGNELSVDVNDDGVPNLQISNLYKSLLSKGKAAAEGDKEASEYVQDKLRAAMWLIKSIHNRQKTILKVAKAIVKYQPEFFRKGPSVLKPMILKDIAYEIGMHESTVSRVTTNKYMHTPIGTFELKYFFNAGIGGANGGVDIAAESLKLKIKQYVDNENSGKPLSDQKIADLLKREDIVVARRTIAKYREILGILPSSKRKKKA